MANATTRAFQIGEVTIREKLNDSVYEYYCNGKYVFGVQEKDRFTKTALVNLYENGYFDIYIEDL